LADETGRNAEAIRKHIQRGDGTRQLSSLSGTDKHRPYASAASRQLAEETKRKPEGIRRMINMGREELGINSQLSELSGTDKHRTYDPPGCFQSDHQEGKNFSLLKSKKPNGFHL
jgi:hypothetical protein